MRLYKVTKIEGATLEEFVRHIEVCFEDDQDILENLVEDVKEVFPSIKDWNKTEFVDEEIIADIKNWFNIDNNYEDDFIIWDPLGDEMYVH